MPAMQMIAGKFYVLDIFSQDEEPVAGPFDSREDAEAERRQMNIAEDCIVRRYIGRNVEV